MFWDILIIIGLALVGGYAIYWVLVGRKALSAPKRKLRDKQDQTAEAVDQILRDAHVKPAHDFKVVTPGSNSESTASDDEIAGSANATLNKLRRPNP